MSKAPAAVWSHSSPPRPKPQRLIITGIPEVTGNPLGLAGEAIDPAAQDPVAIRQAVPLGRDPPGMEPAAATDQARLLGSQRGVLLVAFLDRSWGPTAPGAI
jgi:hypothetical protein